MRSPLLHYASCCSALRPIALVKLFSLTLFALLGLWIQPASACPEVDAAVHQREAPREISIVTVAECISTIAAEHCCECSVLTQRLPSAAPDGKQSVPPPDSEEVISFQGSSRADLVGVLAARTEASNSAVGAARRPAYLLTSRLRQ